MEYGYTHSRPLQQGDEIRMFQEKLNTIRQAYHGTWDHLQTDGIYGRRTRDTVKAFQIFMGLSPSGNMDMMTQAAINSKHEESRQTYSFWQPVQNYQHSYALYTNAGNIDWSDYTKSNSTVAAGLTSFPSTYALPSHDDFISKWKGTFENIVSEVGAIIREFINGWKNWDNILVTFDRVKTAVKNHLKTFTKIGNSLQLLGETVYVKIDDLTSLVEAEGKAIAAKEAEKLKEATKAGKAGKVLKWLDWAIALLDLLYSFILYLAASPNEKEQRTKEVKTSVDNFFKTLCNSVVSKIIEIIISRIATGAIAGTVVPGAGNAVGAVVGIIIAIVDIIIYALTGKTIGDRVWDAAKSLFSYIGSKVVAVLQVVDWERASVYQTNAYMGLNGRPSFGPKY